MRWGDLCLARLLKNLEMSHVEIVPEQADVHRADFFAITAPAQSNFTLRHVSDLRILWSRAAKDVTLAAALAETL